MCGAIIVVTRYVSGNLNFGAVLATLMATMGDAAFLLLATEPQTGVLIMVLGFSVRTISGWLADATHGRDFLRSGPVIRRTIADANFVTSWVIVAFLIFWCANRMAGLAILAVTCGLNNAALFKLAYSIIC